MKCCLLIADLSPLPSRLEPIVRRADLAVPLTAEGELRLGALAGERPSVVELLSRDRFQMLARRALQVRDRFLAGACAGERLDGIDWPALFLEDRYLFFFRDVLLAQALADHLIASGFREVIWVSGRSPSGEPIGEIFFDALCSFGDSKLEVRRTPDPPGPGGAAAHWDRLVRFARRTNRRLRRIQSRLPAPSKAVAVFSTSHWRRYRAPVLELREALGDSFQLWYLGPLATDLRSWTKAHGVSLWSVPYPLRVEEDIRCFFRQHERRWADRGRQELARELGLPALASEALRPRFEMFFRYTLPRAAQWGRTLRRHLQQAAPEWLLGSAAYTYMTALPYHVARSLGVASIGLSHTYVSGDHSPVASTYLACRNRFERLAYRRSFPADERVLYCRNAADALSYQPDPAQRPDTGLRLLVSLLTASPTLGSSLMAMIDTGEFARTLRALADPPEDLAGFELTFKSHPRFDLSELLSGLSHDPRVRVVPASASVTDLLDASWLNVVVNHYGGVAVDAAATGKPLVFLDSARYFYPEVETLAFAAGEVVRSVEDFWRLLRRLADDPQLYRRLEQRCRCFKERYLEPADQTLASALIRPPEQRLRA